MGKKVPTHLRDVAAKCIFCGEPGLDKTHIWPDWLKNCLPKSQGFLRDIPPTDGVVLPPDDQRDLYKKKQGDMFSQKPYFTCGGCNRGWMKDVEDALCEELKPVIGAGKPTTLKGKQVISLATWVCLFVIMAERHMAHKKTIPASDRFYLKRYKRPPAHWSIFVAGNVGREWHKKWRCHNFGLGGLYVPTGLTPPTLNATLDSQITTCGIGSLLFHVATLASAGADQDFRVASKAKGLVQIWPMNRRFWPMPQRQLHLPPQTTFDDDEADMLADAFTKRLEAQQKALRSLR